MAGVQAAIADAQACPPTVSIDYPRCYYRDKGSQHAYKDGAEQGDAQEWLQMSAGATRKVRGHGKSIGKTRERKKTTELNA